MSMAKSNDLKIECHRKALSFLWWAPIVWGVIIAFSLNVLNIPFYLEGEVIDGYILYGAMAGAPFVIFSATYFVPNDWPRILVPTLMAVGVIKLLYNIFIPAHASVVITKPENSYVVLVIVLVPLYLLYEYTYQKILKNISNA